MEAPKQGNYMLDDAGCEPTPFENEQEEGEENEL